MIDFLPIEWRTLQRNGFTLDKIHYFSNILSPLIADRKKYSKFLIRRDPRDLSRIYVLEHQSNRYLEIPYRVLSRPTITLWEQKVALKQLHQQGVRLVNENQLFRAIEKLREMAHQSVIMTRSSRRKLARIKQTNPVAPTFRETIIAPKKESFVIAEPFKDIETW